MPLYVLWLSVRSNQDRAVAMCILPCISSKYGHCWLQKYKMVAVIMPYSRLWKWSGIIMYNTGGGEVIHFKLLWLGKKDPEAKRKNPRAKKYQDNIQNTGKQRQEN